MSAATVASRLVALSVVVGLMAACDHDSPASPTFNQPLPATPIPPGDPTAITGFVVAFNDAGRIGPVPNLRLKVTAPGPTGRADDGEARPDVVTDGMGRYIIFNVTDSILLFSTDPESGYRFLCDGFPLSTNWPPWLPVVELPVVPADWAGDRRPPVTFWSGNYVNGLVTEEIAGLRRPVAGATIDVDNGRWAPATTTNAKGYYLMCLPHGTDHQATASAAKPGHETVSRRFSIGNEWDIDFDLPRR